MLQRVFEGGGLCIQVLGGHSLQACFTLSVSSGVMSPYIRCRFPVIRLLTRVPANSGCRRYWLEQSALSVSMLYSLCATCVPGSAVCASSASILGGLGGF